MFKIFSFLLFIFPVTGLAGNSIYYSSCVNEYFKYSLSLDSSEQILIFKRLKYASSDCEQLKDVKVYEGRVSIKFLSQNTRQLTLLETNRPAHLLMSESNGKLMISEFSLSEFSSTASGTLDMSGDSKSFYENSIEQHISTGDGINVFFPQGQYSLQSNSNCRVRISRSNGFFFEKYRFFSVKLFSNGLCDSRVQATVPCHLVDGHKSLFCGAGSGGDVDLIVTTYRKNQVLLRLSVRKQEAQGWDYFYFVDENLETLGKDSNFIFPKDILKD